MPALLSKSFRQPQTFSALITVLLLCSCKSTYKLSYFMDLPKNADTIMHTVAPSYESKIKYALVYKTFTIYLAYLNHKITVLGEVGHPGSFTITSDQTTIFDAIGMAGDITLSGKKENVLLVRDSTNNQKCLVRLDLNSKNII